MTVGDEEFVPNEEQRAATENLVNAIERAYKAYISDDNVANFKGDPKNTMIMEWVVLVGAINGNQTSVDYLLPNFPEIPMHHVKGLLVEAMDDLRGGEE